MAKFLRALAKIQTRQEKEGKNNETKIVTALLLPEAHRLMREQSRH